MKSPTTLTELAQYILSPECRRISILTGAGVSVAASIPDFRSPGGLYATLRPDLLTATDYEKSLMATDPTYVVSWEIFQRNQFPYLEVRRPFILGTRDRIWKATIAHRFFELLHVKIGKLVRLYTQNIDGLDFQCTKIPRSTIVPVHGSIGLAQCEGCGQLNDYEAFCDAVERQIKDIYAANTTECANISTGTIVAPQESTPVLCEHCNEPLVKPATVLFGRNLPPEFFRYRDTDKPPDVLFIAGTSLQVSPANSIVTTIPSKHTIRVLVNREPVGAELGLGSRENDLFFRADCDDVFLQLIVELGWLDDLPPMDELPETCRAKVEKAKTENAYKNWF